jgi:hypothetical protein
MLLLASALRLVSLPGLLRQRLVPSSSGLMRIMRRLREWIMRRLREDASLAAMGLEVVELI